MSQRVTQNVSSTIQVILTLNNAPVTGLTFSDVTANLRKAGGAFAVFALTASNFTEVGFGTYEITLAAGDVDTLGTASFVVDGAGIDQSTTFFEVVGADVVTSPVTLQTCNINGHVYDATGSPIVGAAVSARVIGLPSIEQSQAAVTNELVTATTDANGEFNIALVRLADVEITIPMANFRRQLVVPNQASISLFEIP